MMSKKIIKASAGTGKTYTLSLEYISALLEGIDYKDIFVMTFTRKATSDIKDKFLERMKELIYSDNDDLKKNIEKILGKEINYNKNIAIKEIYEDILKNKDKLRIYTIDSFVGIIFDNIVLKSLGMDTYKIIDENENRYFYKLVFEEILKNEDTLKEYSNFFEDDTEKDIEKYLNSIKSIISNRWKVEIIDNLPKKNNIKLKKDYLDSLKELFSYIENDCQKTLDKALKKESLILIDKDDETLRKICQKQFATFLKDSVYKKTITKDEEKTENLKSLNDDFAENLAIQIFNSKILKKEEDYIKLSKKVFEIYDRNKFKEKKFTFDDISTYVYTKLFSKNIFSEKEFLEGIDMKMKVVFIDEFQDTSILQWKILSRIIKNSEKIVCVGDEKQSIYGWRGGEKKLFENLAKIIGGETKILKTSYRSDKCLIDYTNEIFSDKYGENFISSDSNSSRDGFIEIINSEGKKFENIVLDILKKIPQESHKNTAIISRENKILKAIAKVLEKNSIKYKLHSPSDKLNIDGIFECLQLLEYLYYDYEINLYNFLFSNLFEFSDEEKKLILISKDKIIQYINDDETKNNFSIKLKNILDKVKKYKFDKLLDKLLPFEFFQEVYDDFDILKKFCDKNSLKYLYEFKLIARSYTNLNDFLNDYKSGNIELENSSEESGLELLTIHKSKGLEYETVIFYEKAKKSLPDLNDFIFEMDENFNEIKFYVFYSPKYKKIIELVFPNEFKRYKNKLEEEEINNLYVALTRAKNNLFYITDQIEERKIGNFHITDSEKNNPMNNEEDKFMNLFQDDKRISSENTAVKFDDYYNINKFDLESELKRVIGLVVHYFLENIKYAEADEIIYSKKITLKKFSSIFSKNLFNKIFSEKNLKEILEKDKKIFSRKWTSIYSEYSIYDETEKKSYRIDRLMIEEKENETEIYIIDYKTGKKDERQLKKYSELILKEFMKKNPNKKYNIETKYIQFNIEL